MTEIIGGLATILISYIAYNGKRLIDKFDRFEKSIQDIMIDNVGNKKDIEVLRRDVDDHEVRITQLEK